MQTITRLTTVTWIIGPLVDRGESETIDEIRSRIHDRSLFIYLDDRYGASVDLSMFRDEDREALLDLFSNLTDIDHRRKFGIEHNGLMLLLAYATEGIQQEFN